MLLQHLEYGNCDISLLALKLTYGKFLSHRELLDYIVSLDLNTKIEVSHKIIEESLRIAKTLFGEAKPLVGFSGGKSSLVVLDLVLEHVPRDELVVFYANTLNEYPGNRDYVIRVVKEHYGVRKLVEAVPTHIVAPLTIWRMFGFPKPSRDRYYTPVCCVLLKELPLKIVIEKYNINIDFNGLQAIESRSRLGSLADNGLVRRTKYIGREVTLKKAIIRVAPVGLWTNDDIWEYIREKKLPVNPVYERYGIQRQGCIVCTNVIRWEEHIAKYNPRLVDIVKRRMEEWGVQVERVRFKNIMERLEVDDPGKLYRIIEH